MHAPAGLDLTYPSVNPRTFGSDPGYDPGGGFHIDEFCVPASLVAEVAVHRGARPENGRRRGLFSVLTTISVAATAFVGPFCWPACLIAVVTRGFPDTAAHHQRPAAAPEERLPSPRLTSLNAATKDLDEAVWLNLSLLGTADKGSARRGR